MSIPHKVVLWAMQRRGYLIRLKKGQNFSSHVIVLYTKADFHSTNLTSEVIFVNEIVRVATSTNACEVT